MKNFKHLAGYLPFILLFLNSTFLFSQGRGLLPPPSFINYQAVARNSAGNVLINQNVSVRFNIHDGSAGGPITYQENQSLTTNQFGLITTFIGSGTATIGTFSAISWSGSTKSLQVELDPAGGSAYVDMGTTQLVSVPYALFSNEALTSYDNAWTHVSQDIYNNNSGKVGIGVNPPLEKLHIEDNSTPNNFGIVHIKNTASGANDAYGIYSESVPTDYYGTGGYFKGGYEGIRAVVAPTGSQYYYGVAGEVLGGTGFNTAIDGTSDVTGVYGSGAGTGKGLTQYYGSSFLETAGVHGQAVNYTSSNGFGYGVLGESYSPTSHVNCGVYGYAAAAAGGTNPRNYGVFGVTNGVDGLAVFGLSDNTGDGRALEGDVLQGTTQTGIFTYVASSAAGNYAGFFNGPIYAITASAGVKSFKIDHPLDPANKFLYHSSVESPDMMNIYDGNITTDANGNAKVELPSYFESLNKDFRYQLTCIGTFAQAIIAKKIEKNIFFIKTDKPNVEVSWMVTGIRHDVVAEKYRIVPEVAKTENEKGKYLIPEAYGKPASAAMLLPSNTPKGSGDNKIFNHQSKNSK